MSERDGMVKWVYPMIGPSDKKDGLKPKPYEFGMNQVMFGLMLE